MPTQQKTIGAARPCRDGLPAEDRGARPFHAFQRLWPRHAHRRQQNRIRKGQKPQGGVQSDTEVAVRVCFMHRIGLFAALRFNLINGYFQL
jgi:hypothetical protein